MIRTWSTELRFASRRLRRSPGFTATAVLTLGLAIGANAGIFAVVDTVLVQPLPYAQADRLVHIAASAPGSDFPEEFGVAGEFFVEYRAQTDLIESAAVYNSFTHTMRVGDRTERVRFSAPTPALFETLGATPLIGRLPSPDEDGTVALLSHATWLEWFGGDPGVLGRSYEMMGESRTVIAVMRPGFGFPRSDVRAWIPFVIEKEGLELGRFGVDLVARVAPDVTTDVLVARLAEVASRLPETYGGSAAYARLIEQHRPVVRSLREQLLGDIAGPVRVLAGSLLIVLLIACANVTNLFVVRAERRRSDLALRRAIGAGVSRLLSGQLAEIVLVAVLSGAVAVLVARLALPIVVEATPPSAPRLGAVSFTARSLIVTGLLSSLAALLCGAWPAWRSTRVTPVGVRASTRGVTRRPHWVRDGLVVLQTALALVLLVGSGLLLRSFQQLRTVDPGYETEGVLTFQIAIDGEPGLDDGTAFARFHLDFLALLRELRGVASVGIVENVPLNESVARARFLTEDRVPGSDAGPLIGYTWSGGDYFEAMGIAVLRGRGFEVTDHTTSLGNVVVSARAAALLWPGEDPIGRRLQLPEFGTWETVVGVVEDVMQYSLRDEVQPIVYFPLAPRAPAAWTLPSPAYVVQTDRLGEIVDEIRSIVREVAPSAPMYRVFTMESLAADSMIALSTTMLTLGLASILAVALGMIGLYGVLSFIVAERTREIGVRMALGAEAERVRRMVVLRGGRVVATGVVIGLVVAAAATRTLRALLFGVEPSDPTTFIGVSIAMMLVGVAASFVPAWRASRVDPAESLRAG